jgi:hypothetical protein
MAPLAGDEKRRLASFGLRRCVDALPDPRLRCLLGAKRDRADQYRSEDRYGFLHGQTDYALQVIGIVSHVGQVPPSPVPPRRTCQSNLQNIV